MELSVSNDFISLFLPDQSEFTTDEIIDEFKIYIFRLMNITVDSLIQERINNEYENNQLKVAYKDFFSSRVDSVLNIAKLHNEIITKSNIIKSSLESNIKLIEKNKNTFDENNINKDFEKVTNDIKVNKFILKNQALVHFMSIPYYMIQNFQNNNFDLYIEYYNYVKSNNQIGENDKSGVINEILNICFYVHKKIKETIINLLSVNYKGIQIKNEYMYDILELEPNKEIFDNKSELIINDEVKNISMLMFEIEIYMKKNAVTLTSNEALNYFEEKIVKINEVLSNKEIQNKVINLIYEKYLSTIIKDYFNENNVNAYLTQRDKILNFVNNTKLNENNFALINEIDGIMKKNYFSFLQKNLDKNDNYIKNYFLLLKDVKKFFSSVITLNNPSSPMNALKYEINLILFNNLAYINNIITTDNFIRHKDKVDTMTMMVNHCEKIIKHVIQFFNENLFLLKLSAENEREFLSFKDIFLTNIIHKFLSDIYKFFQMQNAFEQTILQGEKELSELTNKNII